MAFGGYLQANTAVDLMVGPFIDDTDGKTAETGLTVTQTEVRLSKNGGNMAQKNEATSLTHDELGNYVCKLNTTDTNTEGILTIMVHESGALPIKMDYQVLAQAAYISHITAKDTGFMDVDVKAVSADTTAADNLELFTEVLENGTGLIDAGTFKAGAIDASAIAAAAIDNATFAADVGSTAHGTNIIALAVRKILEELNLDHLLKVDTTVAADGDLEAYCVAGTVMAHIMAAGADATAYKASTDSLEANKVHADTIKAETALLASGVNVTQISGDSTAADNLELQYDGTGLIGDTYPFTQASGAALGGGLAINTTMASVTVVQGSEQNLASASTSDDSRWTGDDDGSGAEFIFRCTPADTTSIPVELMFEGYYDEPSGATNGATLQVYNFNTAGWDTIATFTNGSSDEEHEVPLSHAHKAPGTGTLESVGYTIGDVLVKFKQDTAETGNACLLIDLMVVGFVGDLITATEIVDEWETQSQADPTGFHVNIKEVNGTSQTANDNGADINAIKAVTDDMKVLDTTIASVDTADTVFRLTAGLTGNDDINNAVCSIYDTTGGIWSGPRRVTDYVHATLQVTIDANTAFPLAAADRCIIWNTSYATTAAAGSVTQQNIDDIADAVHDETMSDHLTEGTTGAKLNTADRVGR